MPPRKASYEVVIDDVIARIHAGQLKPGEQLPSKRELAASYRVGTGVIDIAIAILRREGYVEGIQGKGVYVAGGTN